MKTSIYRLLSTLALLLIVTQLPTWTASPTPAASIRGAAQIEQAALICPQG